MLSRKRAIAFACSLSAAIVFWGTAVAVAVPQTKPKRVTTVYVTRTGKKYHLDGCRYLSKSKIPMALKDARLAYEPCKVCGPPD